MLCAGTIRPQPFRQIADQVGWTLSSSARVITLNSRPARWRTGSRRGGLQARVEDRQSRAQRRFAMVVSPAGEPLVSSAASRRNIVVKRCVFVGRVGIERGRRRRPSSGNANGRLKSSAPRKVGEGTICETWQRMTRGGFNRRVDWPIRSPGCFPV
jgi:hypothetical protein